MSKLKLYRASAGSGKTFKLTEEYLKLVIANPESYKNILAVTFTNKATEEMKKRVISELSKLANDENSVYLNLLAKSLNINRELVKSRANIVITNILHDYSHFSIKTIESFFQSILQSFTKELGLNSSLRIELNTELVLENAITKFLNDLGKNEMVLKWITEFAFHKINEGYNWNIVNDINRLGKEIFKEIFMFFDRELLNTINNKVVLTDYLENLKSIVRNFDNHLSGIGENAIDIIQKNNLNISDFYYKDTGPAGYFKKLKDRKTDEPKSRVLECLNLPEKWSSVKHERHDQIISLVNNRLNKLLNEAVDFYYSNSSNYKTAKIILKNIHTLGILNDLALKAIEYSRENSLFLLPHGTKLLHEIINENDTPFIYEKAGQWFKHIMIDEFQDTSVMQWKNFKPLIINSLSEGGFNLIVGDVKQSIYRWRNGDWQLLAEKLGNELKNFGIDDSLILDTNWRSLPGIISFNSFVLTFCVLVNYYR